MRENTTTFTTAHQIHAEDGPRLYTYKEAGKLFGLSDRTIFTLVKTGALRACRFGRSVRISSTAMAEFIARHEGGGCDE